MSDAKPYRSSEEYDTHVEACSGDHDDDRIRATVEALAAAEARAAHAAAEREANAALTEVHALLAEARAEVKRLGDACYAEACEREDATKRAEKAEATLRTAWEVLSRAGVSHGQSVEGLEQGLSVLTKARAACAQMRAALEQIQSFLDNSARAKSKGGNEYEATFLRTLVEPVIEAALSSDVGKGGASPEVVRQAVEALEDADGLLSESVGRERDSEGAVREVVTSVRAAHAALKKGTP